MNKESYIPLDAADIKERNSRRIFAEFIMHSGCHWTPTAKGRPVSSIPSAMPSGEWAVMDIPFPAVRTA
ncbi:hypothetical protein Lac3_22050 [Claveliimonas bilis]|nr:hypothetical protein Lac3_22050 [Claveliimonas bilis]